MAETWMNCPLLKRYLATKQAYMKELRLEKWRQEQETELWGAIRIAFADIPERHKEYWIKRLYSFYSKRFCQLVKIDWLVFLGELSDSGAYGRYTDAKARRYCCLVRDTAYWMTHQADGDELRISEPVYNYWLAA